jgi:hypothetical protein
MEKPCENCGITTMIDDDHRICYDCFVELDLHTVNSDLKKDTSSLAKVATLENLQEEE